MRNFTFGEIKDFVWDCYDPKIYPTFEKIRVKDDGKCGRWSIQKSMIFSLDGKFYRTCWLDGATESQDSDFNSGQYKRDDPWDVEEVHLIEVVKKKWVPV